MLCINTKKNRTINFCSEWRNVRDEWNKQSKCIQKEKNSVFFSIIEIVFGSTFVSNLSTFISIFFFVLSVFCNSLSGIYLFRYNNYWVLNGFCCLVLIADHFLAAFQCSFGFSKSIYSMYGVYAFALYRWEIIKDVFFCIFRHFL